MPLILRGGVIVLARANGASLDVWYMYASNRVRDKKVHSRPATLGLARRRLDKENGTEAV